MELFGIGRPGGSKVLYLTNEKLTGGIYVATVVIDTNVFLHSPSVFTAFKKTKIVIPLVVIEELDNAKKRADDAGANARKTIKAIDKLQTNAERTPDGSMISGTNTVRIFNSSQLVRSGDILSANLGRNKEDNLIIGTALELQLTGEDVTLISNDGACRVKARQLGIPAETFEKDRVNVKVDDVYSGFREIAAYPNQIAALYHNGWVDPEVNGLYENQFVMLKNQFNEKNTGLGQFSNDVVCPLRYLKSNPWDIQPRNLEQKFFVEALMNPKIQLVSCIGMAGTGKTLLAAAASLQLTLEDKLFNRAIYYKPVVPIGYDLGALPGTEQEKLRPWMASAYDAYEYLMGNEDELNMLIEKHTLELSAMTYIRGRSLPGLFLIIDEAQNLTPNQVKTIISRAGEGTKVVILGDPYQIDHPFLDSQNNGLVYMVERFKGQKEFAHITLKRAERSKLAGLAAELL
jgi:PhoH-like ATPase